jgi:hypothetical protein
MAAAVVTEVGAMVGPAAADTRVSPAADAGASAAAPISVELVVATVELGLAVPAAP